MVGIGVGLAILGLLLGRGVLVLLVLGDQIVHVGLSYHELYRIIDQDVVLYCLKKQYKNYTDAFVQRLVVGIGVGFAILGLLLGRGVLVLLVLGDQIVHVRLSFHELQFSSQS